MNAGAVTEPADDNALTTYRSVLALDPENKLADAGLATIERTYLDRALGAAAQDKFSDADADGDSDVDLDDFGRFQRCYSGALPYSLSCINP